MTSNGSDPGGRLSAEREQAVARLARLTADFDDIVAAAEGSNLDDEHDPEGATIAFERSQVDALTRQTRQRIVDIDAAQARVADGTYGVCVTCGEPIAPARLEARPAAATCVECA